MKEILPCLNIKKKIIPENEQGSYRHGWNYEYWLKEIEDDPYYEPVDPVLLVRSLYAKQPRCNPPVNIFTKWFSEKYLDLNQDILRMRVENLARGVVDNLSDSSEDIPIDSETEAEDSPTLAFSPFGQFLNSLDDISSQSPRDANRNHLSAGLLQVFPPVDEEMTWGESTTPPALRRRTDEEVDEELHSATEKTKLFDTDDDFADIDDITSVDSDDVFFDESILEVSINSKRTFSRQNPLRRQVRVKENNPQTALEEESPKSSEMEAGDGSDEWEEDSDKDDRTEETEETHDDILHVMESRPRRNVPEVNYALFHSRGRKGE